MKMKDIPRCIKKLMMMFIVFSIGINLGAQKRINPETLNIDQLNLYRDKAVKKEKAGIILTIAGGAAALTGTILMNNLSDEESDPTNPKWQNDFTLTFVGGIALWTGVPLWIIGSDRKHKADLALKKFEVRPDNKTAIGIGLRKSF
jgi:hypothetical protein